MEREPVVSDTAFVAMWFGESVRYVYDDAIKPAIKDAGYLDDRVRVDEIDHNDNITDKIIAGIRQAKFVIADLTCPISTGENGDRISSQRGGVYYEAGFAKGLGKEVIFTCREDCKECVHFDIAQINRIEWKDSDVHDGTLKEKIKNRIIATIGKGPINPEHIA